MLNAECKRSCDIKTGPSFGQDGGKGIRFTLPPKQPKTKQNKKQKIQMKTKQTTQIIAETMFFKTLEVAVKTLDITMKDSDP